MKNILAFDTSRPGISIAVSVGDQLLADLFSDDSKNHCEKLLPAIVATLKKAKILIDQIDLLLVVAGPGSFTGIRVALSTAKGLAFKSQRPVVALSSLEAMACSFNGKAKRLVSTYNALRGNLFCAFFEKKDKFPKRISPDKILAKRDFLALLKEGDVIIGDGIELIGKNEFEGKNIKVLEDIKRPIAKDFLLYGLECYKNGLYIEDVYSLTPAYLQDSAAEEKLKEKRNS